MYTVYECKLCCVVIICNCLPVQSINEDSLKRLNSYLEDLQKKKPVNPTHLMFYLKNDTATSLEEGKSHILLARQVCFL